MVDHDFELPRKEPRPLAHQEPRVDLKDLAWLENQKWAQKLVAAGTKAKIGGSINERTSSPDFGRGGSQVEVMMLLTGARYNQGMHERLHRASCLKRQILRGGGTSYPQVRSVKLKSGDIQKTVLRVLEESEVPLHVRDVHTQVEEQLRKTVSRDTVRSCLTEGVRLKRFGMCRVGYGIYSLTRES